MCREIWGTLKKVGGRLIAKASEKIMVRQKSTFCVNRSVMWVGVGRVTEMLSKYFIFS